MSFYGQILNKLDKFFTKIKDNAGEEAIAPEKGGALELIGEDGVVTTVQSGEDGVKVTISVKGEKDRAENAEKLLSDRLEPLEDFLATDAKVEGVIDTLKEIQEYITDDGEAAALMVKDIGKNAQDIATEVAARQNADEQALNAAKGYTDSRFTELGTASQQNVEFFATAEQGAKADSAVQSINSINATLANLIITEDGYLQIPTITTTQGG